MPPHLPDLKLIVFLRISSALTLALVACGWGSVSGLLEHPARLAACLLVVGIVLRVGPMFALGRRFRVPWASQQEHRLVTTGFYRFIRNPSYLGAILIAAGWALVFRGGLFLVAYLIIFPALFVFILRREEAMLLAEFGDEYVSYQKRTWRTLAVDLLNARPQFRHERLNFTKFYTESRCSEPRVPAHDSLDRRSV